MMEWQPIETAPTDGTQILACWKPTEDYHCRVVLWQDGCWLKEGDSDGDLEVSEPSHWMALPEPPK